MLNKLIANSCKIFFLSFLMMSIFNAEDLGAQADSKEIKGMIREANLLFEETDYGSAYTIYRKLDSLEPGNAVYKYRIGVYYALSSNNKTKAIPYLEFAQENINESELPFSANYYLGMAYHFDLQLEEAIICLKKYREDIIDDQYESNKIDRLIENCNNGIELLKTPVDVAIRNLGTKVNSKYSDHSPFISADESSLIFTSRRKGSIGGLIADDGQYMEDIYMSKKNYNEWSDPQNMDDVNSKEMDACVGVSVDGQKMFIYKAGKGGSDIYVSKQDGDNWTEPVILNNKINTSKYNENSASLSVDGSMLYFSSDKPGGYGGFDIYVSKLLPSGDWDVAESLGPKVNSKYDEDSPFIHPDNKTLYYSSNGFNSMGGNDIFFSKLENDKWTVPINMGHPINSPSNDNTIVISANNKHAYFTAERKGGYGGNDIYVASLPETESDALTLVKGIITDRESGKPIKANIKVYDKVTKQRIKYVYAPNPENGRYMMIFPSGKNYDMVIEAEGYSNYLMNIYIPDQKHFYELMQEISLSKIEPVDDEGAGEEITVKSTIIDYIGGDIDKEGNDGIDARMKSEDKYADLVGLLEKIILNTDSVALLNLDEEIEALDDDTLTEKAVVKETNYNFLIDVISTVIETTDSLALENLDAKLETEVSVEKYLYEDVDTSSAGISIGGSNVKILGKVDVGEKERLEAEERKRIAAEKRELERQEEEVRIRALMMEEEGIDEEPIESVQVVEEESIKEPDVVKEVKSIEFEKNHVIEFVYGSFDLTANSKKKLSELLNILNQDKSIRMEIHGHADNKGEEEFNMRLSEKRSKSVLKYFQQKNVDANRVQVFNWGEEKPIASNENEEGRQKNRRVEIKLIKKG